MGWKKRNLIEQAFEEIGLAPYVYDASPSQYQSALLKLDSMMAEWNANGIRIGYHIPVSPDGSDLEEEAGIPDCANGAVYLNLAIRLAPSYGKTVSSEAKFLANEAYNILINRTVLPVPEKQFPNTLSRGAGNKPWRNVNNPFLDQPRDLIDVGDDNILELGN